jgi:hypothetical protein
MMTHLNNSNSISKYYIHFAKGNKKELDEFGRKFKKNKREKLNNNYDKLFFNFLLVVRAEELSLDYNKNVETKLKYEFAHKMENMKFKKLENVINNLCYEENINLKTLSALCCLFSKTMYYYSQHVFVELNKCENDESEKIYLVKADSSVTCVKEEKLAELKENSFEIQSLDKIFYSMTHYKVDTLKEIGLLIGLNIDGKKKEIYDRISQHLSNAIFIKN